MKIEDQDLENLRKFVEKKFGKEISNHSDCLALEAELKLLNKTINPQTIRRFFGHIKYNGGFSEYTKDVFAFYVGYPTFSAFKKSVSENEISSFFKNENQEFSSTDFWLASEDLCKRMMDSPSLLAKTHHQVIQYPSACEFFVEHHPMRDLSCTVYAQYFHEYLKYKNTTEAKLFAYGFLFMGAFLSENEILMELYHSKIAETQLSPEVYLLPAGRKYGVQLLYTWLKNDDEAFQKSYQEMLSARKDYIKASEKSVCSFEYAVLEHLIFTNKTEEMQFLIENNTAQKYKDREFVPQDRKENHDEVWKILCAVAYFKMGNNSQCQYYLNSVDIKKLAVGWVKYYSILFYFILAQFANTNDKKTILNKIYHLISETHFTYYQQYINSTDDYSLHNSNTEVIL